MPYGLIPGLVPCEYKEGWEYNLWQVLALGQKLKVTVGDTTIRFFSKTKYGTFIQRERKQNNTVGNKQSALNSRSRPACKGTLFFFVVIITDMSTFKHPIGRCASDQVTEQTHVDTWAVGDSVWLIHVRLGIKKELDYWLYTRVYSSLWLFGLRSTSSQMWRWQTSQATTRVRDGIFLLQVNYA